MPADWDVPRPVAGREPDTPTDDRSWIRRPPLVVVAAVAVGAAIGGVPGGGRIYKPTQVGGLWVTRLLGSPTDLFTDR